MNLPRITRTTSINLCYSGSERFCNADNDGATEILELSRDNIELISKAFKDGIEDGTVRSDLDPWRLPFICASPG
jgi:hypothetical protein